jgi:CMP-N-acetylneuraminic acid synthetase
MRANLTARLQLPLDKSSGQRHVTYDYKNRGRSQDRKPLILENGSIYIFKPEILRRERNRIGGKIAVHLMENWLEIDDPKDVNLIAAYFEYHRFADVNPSAHC